MKALALLGDRIFKKFEPEIAEPVCSQQAAFPNFDGQFTQRGEE
tara:strand:+ start:416 stop:547 length:132 start_codon:yes stop_codon:yes gene_type:complete